MDSLSIVDILVNIVFWVLVVFIAWNQFQTPQWAYIVLFAYVIYFALRFIFTKRGMERIVWLYSLNMLVILYLLYIFLKK